MNIMSCTFTITPSGDKFEAYCEEAKQIIAGSAANGFGNTPSEAMQDAYNRMVAGIAEEKELEVQAALDELLTETTGNLTPGGFGGPCEFTDELEGTAKSLISMVHKGMTEREQQHVSNWIINALADIELERHNKKKSENKA